MNRKVIQSSSAPAAVGAYSQALKVSEASEFLFASGQIGLDPATGAMVEGGVEAEARRALQNLKAVLEEGGFQMSDIVRATLYLVDMGDFAAVNAIYASHFADEPPARVAIAVAALPKGGLFEIDAIAVR